MADVRKLPLVLADEEATSAFTKGGIRSIENAIDIVEAKRRKNVQPSASETSVADAGMATLAQALLDRINSMPRQEYIALRNREYKEAEQEVEVLRDLVEQLQDLLEDVSK